MEMEYPSGFVIYYTDTFQKEYRKLSIDIKKLAEKKERIFRKNPFDNSLKTHKLNGYTSDCWAFSVNNKYRIVFEFAENKKIHFEAIGTHDIYL